MKKLDEIIKKNCVSEKEYEANGGYYYYNDVKQIVKEALEEVQHEYYEKVNFATKIQLPDIIQELLGEVK